MIDNAKVSPEVGFKVLEGYDKFIKEVHDLDPSSSARKQLKDEHVKLDNEIKALYAKSTEALHAKSTKPENKKLWEQLSK